MEHPSKILKRLDISPLKRFGQNFLINQNPVKKIVRFLEEENNILEIGPGLGVITDMLLNKKKLILCEKDNTLSSFLEKKYLQNKNIKIINDDFLKVEPIEFKQKKITAVISNLPFYITTDIIIRIVKDMSFIQFMLVGMQKEVAERILKKEGSSLAVFLNLTGDTKKAGLVSRNNFYPVPEVDSVWILWTRNNEFKKQEIEKLEFLLRASFWGKRKKMSNNLKKNPFFNSSKNKDEILRCVDSLFSDSIGKSMMSERPDNLSKDDFLYILKFF